MSVLLIAAALAVQGPNAATEWVRVLATERATLHVDRASLTRRGPHLDFRMRAVGREAWQGVRIMVAEGSVDCRSRAGRLGSAQYYDAAGVPIAPLLPGLSTMAQGSPEAAMFYERLCRGVRR